MRGTRGTAWIVGTVRPVVGVVDELFPRVIDAAERELDHPWSPDPPSAYCHRCGASAGPGSVTPAGCAFCHADPPPWDAVTRLSAYEDPVAERIRQMKFRRQWQWAPWFGQRLAAALPPLPAGRVVVAPVPMHLWRRWRRGFNQAALIARAVADARGWPVADLLRRTRHTPPQTDVLPSQRHANVVGSVAAEPVDLTGHTLVLVDDVKTSGATLAACTRLLRRLGAARVHVAVAAVADPRGRGFAVTEP